MSPDFNTQKKINRVTALTPPKVIIEKKKCAVAFIPASRVCVHLFFGHLQIIKRDVGRNQ